MEQCVGIVIWSLAQNLIGTYLNTKIENFLIENAHLLLVDHLETDQTQTTVKTPAEALLMILDTVLEAWSVDVISNLSKVLKWLYEWKEYGLETAEQFYFICCMIVLFVDSLVWRSQSNISQILDSYFTELFKLFLTIDWDNNTSLLKYDTNKSSRKKKRKYNYLCALLTNDNENVENEMFEQILYFFQHIYYLLYCYPLSESAKRWRQQFNQLVKSDLNKCSNAKLKYQLKLSFG